MPIDLNEQLKKRIGGEQPRQNQPQKDQPKNTGESFLNSRGLVWLIVGVILVLILVIARPFVVIRSGEVGIKVTAGKYDNTPLQPGFHFFVPILQDVIVVDTRVRIINFSRTEDMGVVGKNQGIIRNDAISVMDSRGLSVSIELTVQYSLNPSQVPQTIATYGLSW